MTSKIVDHSAIINFWFTELTPSDWWRKDDKQDQIIAERFLPTLEAAARCELFAWRKNPHGRLAEIIVLDQFSRNVYRNTAQSFANDSLALALCQEAIAMDIARMLPPNQRAFLYMPLMHSESLLIHKTAVEKFSEPGLENSLGFEQAHLKILELFGRYPHRNAVLGRESTPDELRFLEKPGSSF